MAERGLVCVATVRLEGPDAPATPIRVLSTRLLLPHLSAFILSPQVWRDARDTRADRARQMREVAQLARDALPETPVICGGDFNTPAGDSLFEILQPELRDAYREGGAGWPNTVISSAPMSRVDQVWVSEQFEVVGAWVRRTAYSDHRAVIVDATH
jgi:endonuclease/exonuclease/phosphatase (EEP) superfamily protein YafD